MRKVYHGGTCIVDMPLCHVGRNNLDFGKGFYVTDIREQAIGWATRIVNLGLPQWLNVYELDMEFIQNKAKGIVFKSYDQKWLDFIVDSRNGNKSWLGYDYVEGGVADDRVITTIEDYINGDISMEFALKRLSEHQPNNQICILSQSLIDKCLQYIKSEPLNEFARKEVEHA